MGGVHGRGMAMVLGSLQLISRSSLGLVLVGLLGFGCAASGNVQVGSSLDTKEEASSAESDDAPPTSTDKSEAKEKGKEAGEADKEEAEKPPRALALAREALHHAKAPENHLGLVMAISERTSDLHWVLAVENRSTKPVTLAAVPELLSFTVVPPKKAPEPIDESIPKWKRKKKKVEEPPVCRLGKLPSKVSAGAQVKLAPGEMLFHEFDPRAFCERAAVLVEGAEIQPLFGFPIETKKLWKGGKLVEVVLRVLLRPRGKRLFR